MKCRYPNLVTFDGTGCQPWIENCAQSPEKYGNDGSNWICTQCKPGYYAFDGKCYECGKDEIVELDDGTLITLLGDEHSTDCVECPDCVANIDVSKSLSFWVSISTSCFEDADEVYVLDPSQTTCVDVLALYEGCYFNDDVSEWYVWDNEYYC